MSYRSTRVLELLCRVEDLTGKLAQDNEKIKTSLKDWHDGKLKSSYFISQLTKYIDAILKNK